MPGVVVTLLKGFCNRSRSFKMVLRTICRDHDRLSYCSQRMYRDIMALCSSNPITLLCIKVDRHVTEHYHYTIHTFEFVSFSIMEDVVTHNHFRFVVFYCTTYCCAVSRYCTSSLTLFSSDASLLNSLRRRELRAHDPLPLQ